MSLNMRRRVLWLVVTICLLITWLPNFGMLNSLQWVGPLPLPMAWVLGLNVILTVCVALTYPLCFKPLIKNLEEYPIEESHSEQKRDK